MARSFAALILALPVPVLAQSVPTRSAMDVYREKTQVVRPCPHDAGAIVVCGNRAERNARERIPLPDERETVEVTVRGEVPRASAVRVRTGACGVEGGQGAGCTGGLPVIQGIMLLTKIGTKIIDPEHDFAPPPLIPDRFKGATPP